MSDSPKKCQGIERYIGQRIRERRVLLGLTQQQLAQLIGVTYQQAHKYERGVNRVSAGRLYQISQVLGVSVGYFYEDYEESNGHTLNDRQRLCLEVSRNFANIPNTRHQQAVSQLCRILAAEA
ncbi:MAG: helix-turn-helix transcriptional regulator [Pseudomonadota bacterium]